MTDFTQFFYGATAFSFVYMLTLRAVQNRLMDKKAAKEVQDDTKLMNELYKEGNKNNDKHKLDEANKISEQLMPKMNKMLFGQLKMMVVILAIFYAFTYALNYVDPTTKDDFKVNLTISDGGAAYAQFSLPQDAEPSFWYATLHAYSKDNNEVASNQTVFYVGGKTDQILWLPSHGEENNISADSEVYKAGDRVTLHAYIPKDADHASVTLNNGTRFYVDLPVTIPLINLRRIYDVQSWFIFSALLWAFALNFVIGEAKKRAPNSSIIKLFDSSI